jgi:long-chain fatty acid transport protein
MRMTKNAIAAALLAPALALANGYDVPNVNPRDLAMVGSGVAAQSDAAAAFANAGALSRLPGWNLSLAGSILMLNTTWNDPTGGTLTPGSASLKKKPAPPVSLFASYGFDLAGHGAGVGVGLNVPAGGNVFWDDQWAGRGRIITVDRKIYGSYLSFGYEVVKQLRLGASAVYYYGTEYLKQGVQPFPDAFGELATKGGALSFGFSAEAKPFDDVPLTLGADFKNLGKMTLKGDGHFQVPGALATQVQDVGVTHVLTYPSALQLGAAYRVAPPLLLTAAFSYNWYEVYQDDVFAPDKNPPSDIVVPRSYGNGQTYRLGAEYDLNPLWQLRAGVLRDISGLKKSTYSPTLPDGNVWVGAFGAGYRFTPDLALGATFYYAKFDTITSEAPAFPGKYDTNVWIVSAGITWRRDAN